MRICIKMLLLSLTKALYAVYKCIQAIGIYKRGSLEKSRLPQSFHSA